VIVVFSRIVELAMACAAADGVSDAREKEVIQEWIENWAQRMEEEGLECVSRFRGTLMAILSSTIRSSFTQELAAFALHEHAEGKRMEALALCVRVISVDGVLHDKEMKMIEHLADLLVIDRAIMRSLFDKQFASSGIVVSPDNLEALVGIDPSWDKEQIRKHLAERFMKWNSLSPSAKTTEDQARTRAMLDAIAKLKKKYA
jgi:tellurite resistance protein